MLERLGCFSDFDARLRPGVVSVHRCRRYEKLSFVTEAFVNYLYTGRFLSFLFTHRSGQKSRYHLVRSPGIGHTLNLIGLESSHRARPWGFFSSILGPKVMSGHKEPGFLEKLLHISLAVVEVEDQRVMLSQSRSPGKNTLKLMGHLQIPPISYKLRCCFSIAMTIPQQSCGDILNEWIISGVGFYLVFFRARFGESIGAYSPFSGIRNSHIRWETVLSTLE